MNYKQEFVVLGELPDLNKIIKLSKSHYMAYSTAKKRATEQVIAAAIQRGVKPVPEDIKIDISCLWTCSSRRKDPDNVHHGVKYILDGLVSAGILFNDGWKQIGSISHDQRVGKVPQVFVQIEERTE